MSVMVRFPHPFGHIVYIKYMSFFHKRTVISWTVYKSTNRLVLVLRVLLGSIPNGYLKTKLNQVWLLLGGNKSLHPHCPSVNKTIDNSILSCLLYVFFRSLILFVFWQRLLQCLAYLLFAAPPPPPPPPPSPTPAACTDSDSRISPNETVNMHTSASHKFQRCNEFIFIL